MPCSKSGTKKALEYRACRGFLKLKKFGNNAVFKGVNLKEEGTALERNRQIGGNKE